MRLFNIFKKKKTREEALMKPKAITNILVLDDASINRYILNKYIKKLRPLINVDEACNGQEAIAMSNQKEYDIILLDIKMPGMNGIEASKVILNNRPDTIIYGVTGQIESNSLKMAENAGIRKCLGKPICLADLESLLNQ